MTTKTIDVLVVDDSAVARLYLAEILRADPQIRIVGMVHGGNDALAFIQRQVPDVILMDIHMPGMDGFEATRHIMETRPLPIVICTATTSSKEVATTFRVMEAGAVAFVEKPVAREHPDYPAMAENLRQTIKLMSEVKVVRRWPRARGAAAPVAVPPPVVLSRGEGQAKIRAIGIGASTGGPPVLQTILGALPKDFPVPILVVQHIAPGFLPGLAEWLAQTTAMQIQIAAYGMWPLPGHVYLAPDDFHLGLTASGRILLTRQEPENGLRPAVSFLFRSLGETCGPAAIGVLLTGMGRDGAAELKWLKDQGAFTIAQDRESSVVHGMPGEAIALGGATHILPPDHIAGTLLTLINQRIGQRD